MSDKPILFKPAPGVQTDWEACTAFEKLLAGGAGAGKSICLLANSVRDCANPAMRSLILRLSYPMLKDLIAASHLIFAPMGARYNVQLHQWTFPSGAIVEFGAIENTETCITNYSGRSFTNIAIDEIVQLAGDTVDVDGRMINGAYSFLKSRLRATEGSGLEDNLQLASTGSPGGVGQGWIRDYFGLKDGVESCETRDPITGTRRAYFHCTVADNPYLRNTSYAARLEGLPSAQKKALLHGDFSAFVGQTFTEWNFHAHTCDAFAIPRSWPLWRGADDGFASEAAILWFAKDEINDRVYVIREIYQRGLTATELGRLVLETDRSIPIKTGGGPGSPLQMVIKNDEPLRGVIDSASFASVGSGSRGDEMNAMGCNWTPCEKGPGSRIGGVNRIHEFLAVRGDGLPGLIFFREHCRCAIRELPAMTYGSGANAQDIDPGCPRHLTDALAYGLSYGGPPRAGRVRVF